MALRRHILILTIPQSILLPSNPRPLSIKHRRQAAAIQIPATQILRRLMSPRHIKATNEMTLQWMCSNHLINPKEEALWGQEEEYRASRHLYKDNRNTILLHHKLKLREICHPCPQKQTQTRLSQQEITLFPRRDLPIEQAQTVLMSWLPMKSNPHHPLCQRDQTAEIREMEEV